MSDNPSENQNQMLPLDAAERGVTFKDKEGHTFNYFFRRLTREDWRKYFEALSFESENDGKAVVNRFDSSTPLIPLVEEALLRVEGYPLKGGGDIMQLEKWKLRLPVRHKLVAGDVLQDVGRSSAEREFVFDPEVDEVFLDAAWGISPAGKMTKYFGLLHRFTPVTAEHQRRYYRATSESRVIGGSRTGRTIYANRRGILLELYDELIVSVDGYSVGGAALSSADQVRREMDTAHKIVAIGELFTKPEQDAT